MRAAAFISIFCLSGVVGCDQQPYAQIPTDYCALVDMKVTPPADMTVVPPCAAAIGLRGDNLVCVDFSSILDQPLDNSAQLPSQLSGWDFVTKCGGKYWEISANKLQIKNFSTFGDTCGFLIKQIDLNDVQKQKYRSITLSIIQKVDLDLGTTFPNQLEQVYNGTAIPAFLLAQSSGTLPMQQATWTFDKETLPAAMKYVVKYLVQVQSGTANNTKQGLQISSIAINAAP